MLKSFRVRRYFPRFDFSNFSLQSVVRGETSPKPSPAPWNYCMTVEKEGKVIAFFYGRTENTEFNDYDYEEDYYLEEDDEIYKYLTPTGWDTKPMWS